MKKVITKRSAVTTATLALTTALTGCGLFNTSAAIPADNSTDNAEVHADQDIKFPVAKNAGKIDSSERNDPTATGKDEVDVASNSTANTSGSGTVRAENAALTSGDGWFDDESVSTDPVMLIERNDRFDGSNQTVADSAAIETVAHETAPASASSEVKASEEKVSAGNESTSELGNDFEEENGPTVVTPVDEENKKILEAAANLAFAKRTLAEANAAYDDAVRNYDLAYTNLNDHITLVGSENMIETLKASLGQKKALLDIAANARTQAEENLEKARSSYADAIAEASTGFENAFADADEAHNLAVAEAQAKYDRAVERANDNYNAAVFEADTVLQTAKEQHDDAIAQIEETFSDAVAEADTVMREEIESAKLMQDAKIADATAAYNEAVGAAQNAYNTTVASARMEYDATLKAAQDAYDEAVSALDSDAYLEAKARYETAVENQKALVEAKTIADAELADAQAELAVLETKKNAAENERKNAENALNEADNTVEATKAALEEANKTLETAGAYNTEALAAVVQAQQAVDDAESAKAVAEAELESAKRGTTIDSLDQQIADAEARVVQAKLAVAEAQAQIDLGSYGFFQEQNAAEAMAIIDFMQSDKIAEDRRIVLGDEKDATSLDNMKLAIEMIEIGNRLRTTDDTHPGLTSWKITNAMMAIAQANVTHQANTIQHWIYEDGGLAKQSGVPYWNPAENLAWGYGVPGTYTDRSGNPYEFTSAFEGWYSSEKLVYDEMERLNASGGNASAEDARLSLRERGVYVSDSQIGHYENIIGERNELTGFAVSGNNEYGNAYCQEFTSYYFNKRLVNADPNTYTIDDYYNMFMSYYNDVMAARENAEKALADAEKTLADLKASGAVGAIVDPEAVALAEANVVKAEEALETAMVVLSDANITVVNTENALESAKEAVKDREASLIDSQNAKESAEALLETAADAFDKATADVTDAERVVANKETAAADAESNVREATEKVADAETEMNLEKSALDAEVVDKTIALEDAKNSTVVSDAEKEAKAAYDEAVADAETTKERIETKANAVYEVNCAQAEDNRDSKVSEAEANRDAKVAEADAEFETAKAVHDTTVAEADTVRSDSVSTAEVEKTEAVADADKAHDMTYEQLQLDLDSVTNDITQQYNEEIQTLESAVEEARNDEAIAQTEISATLDMIQECADVIAAVETAEVEVNEAQEAVNVAQDAYDKAKETYDYVVDPDGTGDVTLVFEITNS